MGSELGNIKAGQLVVFRKCLAATGEFVDFWSSCYQDRQEYLYLENIGEPLTPSRIRELFKWKNGGIVSKQKYRSIEQNYIDQLATIQGLSADITAEDFLKKFSSGGAIWRIFWLHCFQPHRFPIYDQHVHRAMVYIEDQRQDELGEKADNEKIRLYLDCFLPFYQRFRDLKEQRKVDRALWVFGKFIKQWPFQSLWLYEN